MRYGLIGEKLGHSYSKIIHEMLADYKYDLIPLTREEFKQFMDKKEFAAINVTIPYKQAVIPYLNELHPLASRIGAVNTIVNDNGRLIGYNTDFFGFEYMLKKNDITISGRKCLILGNGGSARTVNAVLKSLGAAKIYTVSRNPGKEAQSEKAGRSTDSECEVKIISYDECYACHRDAQVIVNTTPLGMYPNTDASPLDLSGFGSCEAVVDIIYNPLKTKLAIQAGQLGIKAVCGLEMLVAQAKRSIEYFLGKPLDDALIDETCKRLLKHLSNI